MKKKPLTINSILVYALLFLTTLIITFPRFASVTWIDTIQPAHVIIEPDNLKYIKYVQYFRDKNKQNLPEAPFSYRPLTPYIASFRP
jgi:hypothetical protein